MLVGNDQTVNVGNDDFVKEENGYGPYDLAGAPRQIGIVDLGAYEADSSQWREVPSIIVTTLDDVVNPYDGLISLREVYFSWTTSFDANETERYGYDNGTYFRKFDKVVDATGYTVTFDLAEYFAQKTKGMTFDSEEAYDAYIDANLVYKLNEQNGKYKPLTVKDSMTIDATNVYVGEKTKVVLDENGSPVYAVDENGEKIVKSATIKAIKTRVKVDQEGNPVLDDTTKMIPITIYATDANGDFILDALGNRVTTNAYKQVYDGQKQFVVVYQTDENGEFVIEERDGVRYLVPEYEYEYEYEVETTTEADYRKGVTVDADNQTQVFVVAGTATNAPNLTLKEMTATNGQDGGIVLNEGANLVMIGGGVTNTQNGAGIQGALNTSITLDGVTVSGNVNANGYGGGVSARNGLVTIKNSTFENNSAQAAGGVFAANLYVTNSSFTGNKATATDGNGLGTIVVVSRGRLTNTLVADNEAVTGVAGLVALRNSIVDVYNSTIVNNGDVDLQASRGAKVALYNSIVGLEDGNAYDPTEVSTRVQSDGTISAEYTLSAFDGWNNNSARDELQVRRLEALCRSDDGRRR